MQTFDRLLRRTPAFVFSVSIFAALTACASAEVDSSNTTGTTGTSGGNDTSGGTNTSSGGAGGDTGVASGGAAGGDQGCAVIVASHEPEIGIHVAECSHIDYTTNPPSSGKHYSVWAAYQTYDFPVPRGYWVHGLEHGAIVITYNCPEACPDEVREVESIIGSLPIDPRCVPHGLDHQIILTPDPLLDTRWAMSSWGHTLRTNCVNEAAFKEFYASYASRGPEDICGGGRVLTEATLAPNCGE